MARVLVIDDEAGYRALARRILVREGHQVVEAGNGLQGLKILRTQPIDLVITDILMPEQDGLEMIMEVHRAFAAIPIIAMSEIEHGEGLYLSSATKLGASLALAKPFSDRELSRAVNHLCC